MNRSLAFGGNLYVTFDALVFDFATGMPASIPVPAALYQVDLATGKANRVGRDGPWYRGYLDFERLGICV